MTLRFRVLAGRKRRSPRAVRVPEEEKTEPFVAKAVEEKLQQQKYILRHWESAVLIRRWSELPACQRHGRLP